MLTKFVNLYCEVITNLPSFAVHGGLNRRKETKFRQKNIFFYFFQNNVAMGLWQKTRRLEGAP